MNEEGRGEGRRGSWLQARPQQRHRRRRPARLVGVVGFFVAPGIVQVGRRRRRSPSRLGRKATIGRVQAEPVHCSPRRSRTSRCTKRTAARSPRMSTRLTADVSSASLWKRALVFDACKVEKPTLSIVRLDPQRFNFSDIVDRLAAKPKSDPTRFSVNNIEIDDGTIDVEDRVDGPPASRRRAAHRAAVPVQPAVRHRDLRHARVRRARRWQRDRADRQGAAVLGVARSRARPRHRGPRPDRLPRAVAGQAAVRARVRQARREARARVPGGDAKDARRPTIPQIAEHRRHTSASCARSRDPAGRSARSG